MKSVTKKSLSILIVLFAEVLFLGQIFAQTCPEKTTVNGPTSITFVGGVVDLGGDTEANVWFEYGTSSGNYTFQTEKKKVTQLGKFCITVSNLTPCTTYYYRAAMENKAGPSYGAEQTRTTPCQEGDSGKVLGAATETQTGFKGKIIFEILILPVIFAGLLTILFKPYILEFEDWLQLKKIEFRKVASKKLLEMKISQFRSKRKK